MGSIVNWCNGQQTTAVISAKSMSAAALTVPAGAIIGLGVLFVFVLPIVCLIAGAVVCWCAAAVNRKEPAMTRKKMLPLALLAAVVALLAVLLAVLHGTAAEEETPGIALCPFAAAELDTVSYSGENVEVTLQKGSGGTWRLASDPSLPLDQDDVAALVEQYAALRADRRLQGDELAEIRPAAKRR